MLSRDTTYLDPPAGSVDKQREIARTFDDLADAVQRYHAARVVARGEATSDE